MRVIVTGARGQLGEAIVARFGASATGFGRQDLDICDDTAVERTLGAQRFELLVNCAAYNNVDGAEDHTVAALETNAFGVLALARAAARAGAMFVHYSTDFVFDGFASAPYREDDRPNPQSNYARSKLLGEWFAADAPRHFVLRVESLFGGAAAKSSVDRIVDAIRRGEPAKVFSDRTVTPSYVEDVADATMRLVSDGASPGLYHCVNTGATTWLDLGREIARLLGREAELVPIRMADVPLRAARPLYCALSNEKLRTAGIEMPSWQDALRRYLRG